MTEESSFSCRFGEGYIITVRVQGDLPDLEPLFQFFSEKFPLAVLKVGLGLTFVRVFSRLCRNNDLTLFCQNNCPMNKSRSTQSRPIQFLFLSCCGYSAQHN